MTHVELISIVFRLINFGIVLYGLHYLYTHYLYKAAWEDLEVDEKKVAILAQQKDAAQQQELLVEQQIKNQEQMILHLTRVIEQWRASTQAQQESHDAAQQQLQIMLVKKASEQSQHVQRYMLERKAFPLVVSELEKSLTQYFDQQRGEHYSASIIDAMKKER